MVSVPGSDGYKSLCKLQCSGSKLLLKGKALLSLTGKSCRSDLSFAILLLLASWTSLWQLFLVASGTTACTRGSSTFAYRFQKSELAVCKSSLDLSDIPLRLIAMVMDQALTDGSAPDCSQKRSFLQKTDPEYFECPGCLDTMSKVLDCLGLSFSDIL